MKKPGIEGKKETVSMDYGWRVNFSNICAAHMVIFSGSSDSRVMELEDNMLHILEKKRLFKCGKNGGSEKC